MTPRCGGTGSTEVYGKGVVLDNRDAGVKFVSANARGRRWQESPFTGERARYKPSSIAWGCRALSGVAC